jgi:hypothetical protein
MGIPDKALETGAHHACFGVGNELPNQEWGIASGDGSAAVGLSPASDAVPFDVVGTTVRLLRCAKLKRGFYGYFFWSFGPADRSRGVCNGDVGGVRWW